MNSPLRVLQLSFRPAKSRLLPLTALVALSVALSSAAPSARAADPYDQNLEQRIEALEKELNILDNDSKGKNVQADDTQVPTFLRAAGSNVQQLTISGDLRFRYYYQNEDFQYPGPAISSRAVSTASGYG